MNAITHFRTLLVSFAFLQSLAAGTIFTENFTGAAGNLDGKTTTTGGGTWIADSSFQLSGSGSTTLADSETAFINWTPTAGNIYTLTADMTSAGTSSSSTFAGIGFFNQKSSDADLAKAVFSGGTAPETPWVFVRTGNSSASSIGDSSLRPRGGSSDAQTIDTNFTVTSRLSLKLVLNTNDTDAAAGTQFSLAYYVNEVQYGSTFTYSDSQSTALLSDIKKVGITASTSGNTVSFDNFELSVIPEPSSFVLMVLALGGGCILHRRKG
ncbi:PEP-CTERM sorting domain-containing protein [Kiritimatiellaeota bacterium B1221]|nr:PEP-CTERM sorting domain-containing protein [Kiritimatiellaeota bacterium B1221]